MRHRNRRRGPWIEDDAQAEFTPTAKPIRRRKKREIPFVRAAKMRQRAEREDT